MKLKIYFNLHNIARDMISIKKSEKFIRLNPSLKLKTN